MHGGHAVVVRRHVGEKPLVTPQQDAMVGRFWETHGGSL
jgi:hypothetical protein